MTATHDDGSDIADLMKCFLQSEVNDDRFPQISQRMRYLKQSEGGKHTMCKIMEEYAKEYAKEYAEEYAEEKLEEYSREKICNGLRKGKDPLEIADFFDVSIDYVMSLKEEMDL